MRWITPPLDASVAARISRQFGLSQVIAKLLVRRLPEASPQAVKAFLDPALRELSDPLRTGGMLEAVKRIRQAVERKESVVIFGDYDVDGVTSTVLLTDFLGRFGLATRFVVPRRLEEGYGLSLDSLERAFTDGKPDLLIAVDCGTGSAGEVSWLRNKGVSVLIIDHHTSKESLPEDCILINPHVNDPENVPWKNLCSVGLVFKFCHAFLKLLRDGGDPLAEETDLREYLDLVALGTVADLVALDGENRIFVKHGLKALRACRRPGICTLIEVAGLNLGGELTSVDIGFRLGPRINASGRLDDATLPIQLLLSGDWKFCRQSARMLDSFNRERQDIEKVITEDAEAMVLERFSSDPGIIVCSAEWHAGVVGIVASRLARQFNRPTIVLGSEEDGLLKGSGRSIEGVNLVGVLSKCADHISQWGGHPMAVGLTVSMDNLDALRAAFNEALAAEFPDGLPEPSLTIDGELLPQDLEVNLLSELERLGPFGQGNPEPVFALRGVTLSRVNPLGRGHLRFKIQRPGRCVPIEGVAWNGAARRPPTGSPVDLAVRYHWHTWRGQRSPRLTLLDWRERR